MVGQAFAKYMLKQIIIVVHANPNTQPGGVHGAFDMFTYQSEATPLFVNIPPIASAAKLSSRKIMSL